MKIITNISNRLIQLTMLAQQFSYNRHALTLLEHVNSTLKGEGKKKRIYLEPNKLFSNNGMEISQTMINEN